jgi:hypothetical protein
VDWTSAEALRKAIMMVHDRGARFLVARLPHEARAIFDYHGITDLIGEDDYIDTVRKALKWYKKFGVAPDVTAATPETVPGDPAKP